MGPVQKSGVLRFNDGRVHHSVRGGRAGDDDSTLTQHSTSCMRYCIAEIRRVIEGCEIHTNTSDPGALHGCLPTSGCPDQPKTPSETKNSTKNKKVGKSAMLAMCGMPAPHPNLLQPQVRVPHRGGVMAVMRAFQCVINITHDQCMLITQ